MDHTQEVYLLSSYKLAKYLDYAKTPQKLIWPTTIYPFTVLSLRLIVRNCHVTTFVLVFVRQISVHSLAQYC